MVRNQVSVEPRPYGRWAVQSDRTQRLVKEWFYYVHCLAPADRMRVKVVKQGNEFEVRTWGVEPRQLELMLNPSMVDPAKNVVVRVNGKPAADARPVADFWTILETLDARMDRTLVFDRRLSLAPSQ